MAKNYFYQYTPKTAKYIDSLNDVQRIMHHNYVIEQKYCNSYIAVDNMTITQLKQFDKDCLCYLKYIDIEY